MTSALAFLAACGGGGSAVEASGGSDRAEAPALDLPPFQDRVVTASPRPGAASASSPLSTPEASEASLPDPGRPLADASAPTVTAASDGAALAGAETAATSPQDGTARLDGAALTREVTRAVQRALRRADERRNGSFDASGTTVSVVLVDLRSGARLVDRLGDARLRPASNMKVLTAAAGLLALGAESAFETPFRAAGTIEDGVLRGDLVAEAGGDPLHLREGDGSLDRWLDPLAEDLREAGVTHIDGALVLDEGTFVEPGPAPEWPDASQQWRDYCALAGGFSANGGNFRATVRAGRPGAAGVVLRPRDHGLVERVGVRTGERNDLRIGATATTVTVRGTIPASPPVRVVEFRHPDPVDLFGHAVVEGLGRRGIAVTGRFRRERGAAARTGAISDAPLHVMRSPLRSVLEAVLLDSNNPVADQVFLTVGARAGAGTREGAAEAVRATLAAHGIATEGLAQVDGSGLSKANRVTARTLVETLTALAAAGEGTGEAFLSALPLSSVSGSLEGRMGGTAAAARVRAKTGWISGASGLSGYVLDGSGEPALAFSILVGYPRVGGLNTAAWKPMQDEMCAAFTEALDAAGGAR